MNGWADLSKAESSNEHADRRLSIHPFVCPSIRLFVHPSIRLSAARPSIPSTRESNRSSVHHHSRLTFAVRRQIQLSRRFSRGFDPTDGAVSEPDVEAEHEAVGQIQAGKDKQVICECEVK